MESRPQTIKSEETEEKSYKEFCIKLVKLFESVSSHRNQDGLTYAEFRAGMLKTQLKDTNSSRVNH